jgi:hypothetical protein
MEQEMTEFQAQYLTVVEEKPQVEEYRAIGNIVYAGLSNGEIIKHSVISWGEILTYDEACRQAVEYAKSLNSRLNF